MDAGDDEADDSVKNEDAFGFDEESIEDNYTGEQQVGGQAGYSKTYEDELREEEEDRRWEEEQEQREQALKDK